MEIRERVEAYTEAMIRDIQELIAIPSVEEAPGPGMPFGESCARALEEALRMGEALGLRSRNLDNYAGYLEIGEGEELIGLLTHVDVVPAGDRSHWTYEPYGRTFADGKVYGRGAKDDKGPTVIAMYAMKILQDMGVPLKKRIRHIIGANEETGFRCMEHYNQVEEPITMGFSPDGRFPVVFAEDGAYGLEVTARVNGGGPLAIRDIRGGHAHNIVADNCIVTLEGAAHALEQAGEGFRAYAQGHGMAFEAREADGRLTLTLHGTGAHASVPWDGVNAISHMMEFLGPLLPDSPFIRGYNKLIGTDYCGAKCGVQCRDAYGALTLCNGTLVYDADADLATANLDIRFPVTVDFDRQYAEIINRNFEAEGFTTTYTGTDRSVYMDPDSDFIQALYRSYVEVTGDTESRPIHSGGGTYAKSFERCVAFGTQFPGAQEVAHQSDEFMTLREIQQSTEIYVRALLKLLEL